MIFAENETVELKAKVVSDICKEVVAFANTKVDTLYIGIANNGEIIGVQDAGKVILQINNMVHDSTKPDVTMFVGYLDMHNHTVASFDGLYRADKRDYPEEALREVLLNSIVHRDYSYSAATLISVYDDRIEFVSVGGLPTGIELDISQATSNRILKRMAVEGLLYQVGSGRKTMYKKNGE